MDDAPHTSPPAAGWNDDDIARRMYAPSTNGQRLSTAYKVNTGTKLGIRTESGNKHVAELPPPANSRIPVLTPSTET